MQENNNKHKPARPIRINGQKAFTSLGDDDARLVAQFFDECHQPPVPDEGFSDRVMQSMPITGAAVKAGRVWTTVCASAGVGLTAYYIFHDTLRRCLTNTVASTAASLSSIDLGNVSVQIIAVSALTLVYVAVFDLVQRITSDNMS